jgi:hypothetical protein
VIFAGVPLAVASGNAPGSDAAPAAVAAPADAGEVPSARIEARRTGHPVELLSQRTETSRTYANPDGSFTSEISSGPERVKRNGTWHTIDASLTESGGVIVPKAHPHDLRLNAGGGRAPKSLKAARAAEPRDLASMQAGGRRITLQWKGGLPEPKLDGDRAIYRDALPGADVIVEATQTGFEQFVSLRERPSGGYSYTLPLKTAGLHAQEQNDGSVLFTDSNGRQQAIMPAPVMWDAAVDEQSGLPTNRRRVDMDVVPTGTNTVDLVIRPDESWLTHPATQYPVTIDPSTSALSNTFDTYVQQGETVDWSTDTELNFGNPGTTNSDGTPRTARSFIHWNTTPIQDALISSAKLELYNFHSGNTDCLNYGWSVWSTGAASTSSRWTNQPSWIQQHATSTQTKGNPNCGADGWISADVTTLVQAWASNKVATGHMGLRSTTDDVRAWKRVNSANNTANRPKLTVNYNFRPGNGHNTQAGPPYVKNSAGVWVVDTDQPFLRATFEDADGDQVNGTFDIRDAVTKEKVGDYLVSAWTPAGQPTSVWVPANLLTNGRTYEFRASAYDGTHYDTGWTDWTKFTVDEEVPGGSDGPTDRPSPTSGPS